MTSLSTFAEVGARSCPRWNAPRAHGRTRLDGIRVGSCRLHHATDGERPSGAYGCGWSSQRREAGPASLPSSRLAGCSADDREHHAGCLCPGLNAAAARCRSEKEVALRMARTCYDHLAGRLGVALADALVGRGHLELASDGGLVTDAGIEFFGHVGIDLNALLTG